MKLKVKQIESRFGITDGKKWFAYTYKSKDIAERIMNKLHPKGYKNNICWKEPVMESNID